MPSEPTPPDPTQIVITVGGRDSITVPKRSNSPSLPTSAAPKDKNDDFYRAWDSFLSKTPNRATSTSSLAKRVKQTQTSANEDEEGLRLQECSSTSYDQARDLCLARVAAIVEECTRLNQKYQDTLFDLEGGSDDCLRTLDGRMPTCTEQVGPPPWIKRIPVSQTCVIEVVERIIHFRLSSSYHGDAPPTFRVVRCQSSHGH